MLRIIVLITFILLLSISAQAESRYVTDQLLISLRPAQNDTSPPLEYLSTGMQVEVIEDLGPFLKIKSSTGTVGFARSQYFIPSPPIATTADNVRLKEELVTEKKLNADLTAKLQRQETNVTIDSNAALPTEELEKNRVALAALTKRYQELEQSRSDVTIIIQERDQLKEEVSRLSKMSKRTIFQAGDWASPLQWFLTGGAVLLIGWFAGRTSSSKRRF